MEFNLLLVKDFIEQQGIAMKCFVLLLPEKK